MAAELLTRIFTKEIKPQIFPDNTFLERSKNEDAFIVGNTVEKQNAGTIGDATVDNTTFPLTAVGRTDTAHNYALEELATPLTKLTRAEEYTEMGGMNKRTSIVAQQANILRTKAMDRALVNWASGIAAAQKIPTTGAGRASSLALATTGTRRALQLQDLRNAYEQLMTQDVYGTPTLLVNPKFYIEILALVDDFIRVQDMADQTSLISGQQGMIYGMNVVMRSNVLVTDASDAVKAEGATVVGTDQAAALLWHPEYVCKATGAFNVSIDTNKPEYAGGSLMNSQLRFGAARDRADDKGVVLIYEDTV